MLSVLDPLGLPVASQVVSGEKADDPLYVPAIQQVRAGLQQSGLLYVGDCKLMALETRAYLQAGGDYYLGPFSKVSLPDERLTAYLRPVWAGEQALTPVYRVNEDGSGEQIAEGYEQSEMITTVWRGETVSWTERRLVIRSLHLAQAATAALEARLAKAQTALAALNERRQGKRRFTQVEPLRQAAETLVAQYRVEGLLQLSYQEEAQEHRVRRYGDHPAETRIDRTVAAPGQSG
jgi:transposase